MLTMIGLDNDDKVWEQKQISVKITNTKKKGLVTIDIPELRTT